MPGPSFDPFARRQHGLVTTVQLASLGWTEKRIRHAERIGQLHRLRRGVYRADGAPLSQEQAWLAGALAAPGSLLSHRTATRIWSYPCFSDPDGIDLVRLDRRPRLEGVIGHQTDHLPRSHCATRHRLPVTSAARSLVDACGAVTPKQLRTAANDGLRRRILSLPALVRTVDEVPVSGRRAIVPMVEYLRTKVSGYELGDSDPELDLVDVLVAAGFPRPLLQVRVETASGPRYVDVGWPELRTGFEYDSLEFHVERFHEDRDRLRALKRAGWDIWPITKTTSRNEIVAIATLAFRHEPALQGRLLTESA
jgi:hypothetical protein